ncbi:hypothetical protein DIPPA_03277 [Diplonema papillatum]|nr:hypothetical protein DIPPA_03277 [Diplonema papillatum]
MNLLAFKERWKDMEQVPVTHEDAEGFLCVLLDAATECESTRKHIACVRERALEALHLAVTGQHVHRKAFLQAFGTVLARLGCDDEAFYAPPSPPVPPVNYGQVRQDVEARVRTSGAGRCRRRSAAGTSPPSKTSC